MKKIIEQLSTMLLCEHFIVTGSYALAQYGLLPLERVSDLDIILINPSQGTLELVLSLMKTNPAKTKPRNAPIPLDPKERQDFDAKTLGLRSIFMWEGKKVDVFIVDFEPYSIIDGIKYTLPMNIIQAKKKCNRMKDWLSLRQIAKGIFDHALFVKYLDSNPKLTISDTDDEEYPS
jgi:hypothetical protein